jgi:type VI secretion system protein ImpG
MDDCPDPEDLLAFYERELALLRRSMREFSERYPVEAARLGISGEHCDDPHVERLLQSAAMSNARLAARIEDDYPEVPTELLERLHPEVLRPFPASSIAQIKATLDPSSGPRTIARGTEFASHRGKYRFRSVYDVALAAFSIGQVQYAAVAHAPRSVILPVDTLGIFSICFEAPAERAGFASVRDRVRIFLSSLSANALIAKPLESSAHHLATQVYFVIYLTIILIELRNQCAVLTHGELRRHVRKGGHSAY